MYITTDANCTQGSIRYFYRYSRALGHYTATTIMNLCHYTATTQDKTRQENIDQGKQDKIRSDKTRNTKNGEGFALYFNNNNTNKRVTRQRVRGLGLG